MSDPYKRGMFKSNPYAKKKDIHGELVVVLDGVFEERGLELMQPISRALLRNEVHELILTDEEAGPGTIVNRIAYLGFFEVANGGVVVAGDEVYLENKLIGTIAGYDETHMPNHLNIVIRADERVSGLQRGAEVGQHLVIKKPAV